MADTENPKTENMPDELPAEPEKAEAEDTQQPEPAKASGRFARYKSWYADRKKWTIPATVLLLILVLAAVPFTRYSLAGLVRKQNLQVRILDAMAGTPVSGATVSIGSSSAETGANGMATLSGVKAGHHQLNVSKKYYKSETEKVLAPILKQKVVPDFKLTATGRQVKITVKNLINRQVLGDVDIKVADISAKTDKDGSATVVLPAGVSSQAATLSRDGYNDSKVTVKVSSDKIQDNDFTLTPAGKVYFLSKLSGKIDVVKTNLDGSDRQTVLGGTGNEDDTNTVLLASRDWKYLALLARRAGGSPTLYLIDTSDDSLKTIDEGDADFSLAGWVDGNFVYTVSRHGVNNWQPHQQAIKSYNASTNKLTTLDQTDASGTSNYDYTAQNVGTVYGYNGTVYYVMNWQSSSDLDSSKQATFNSIKPDGTGKKAIKSFAPASGNSYIYVNVNVAKPDKVLLSYYDGSKDNFFVYANGQVKDDPSGSSENNYQNYPSYLLSPSGNNTFWAEPRDGKNTLFIGDEDGENGKQIATLSDYNTYGWYTDSYLLVSKNSSELYAMSKDGSNTVKISDYHKPQVSFPGYGGGYGGL